MKTSSNLLISFFLPLLLIIGCGKSDPAADAKGPAAGKQLIVAVMPKSKGNPYFVSCKKGADEAARELNVKLLWDGPTDPDPARQNEIVETWITRGVDVIAAAVENRDGLSTALRKAREKGIKVITWDSDAQPDARDFLVNQGTPEDIAFTLMDEAARVLGGKGQFAIITASLTAANMNEWQKYIEQRRADKYPEIKMAALRPCDDLKDKAFAEATAILNANPEVKLLMAICAPAVPGSSEAVKQSGRKDVKVIGLGLPNDNKRYVREGITPSVILWNTENLGYLTVQTAVAVAKNELKSGVKTFKGGRLGELEIKGDNVLLGKPFVFNKDNIEQFNF
jgi:rhamnose transport system substrate-binding protein